MGQRRFQGGQTPFGIAQDGPPIRSRAIWPSNWRKR
jgi:hypothetical protein